MKDTDLKRLRYSATKMARVYVPWFFAVMILFYVVCGILNLHRAEQIGRYIGMDLSEIFHEWISGIDIDRSYSGIYLKAHERFLTGLAQFGAAICFLFFLVIQRLHNGMNLRILQYVEKKEK